MPRAFGSLRHRNYRLYSAGQMVSMVGTWMQTAGQAWLVLELTHSPVLLGLVGALQFLPVLLFSLVGGVFADRWPKRHVLLVTQAAAMLQSLLLWVLVATGAVQLWHIYVLALLLGLTTTLDQPARLAFIVEMVGRDDLPNAVALSSSLTDLARVVGPGIGGIIIATSGVTTLFLLNALSFLAVLMALTLIKPQELHSQALQRTDSPRQQSAWQSLREGVGYVCHTHVMLLMILMFGLVLLFGANFSVVLPLFATDVLHVGAAGFGFLSAALGAGALVAALGLTWGNLKPTVRRVTVGLLVFGVLEVGFAISHHYVVSLVLIAGVGAAEAIAGAMAITLLQTLAPDHLRGRVASVYILFFTGSAPPGYLLAGWLSGLYGASLALLMCSLLCVLIAGGGWLWWEATQRLGQEPSAR